MPNADKTMALAAEAAQAKRKFDALTADLAKCRQDEKRLLQEQAKALEALKTAQQTLLKETVEP